MSTGEDKLDLYRWRRAGHVPVLILLQVFFIILFSQFVIYDPRSAAPGHTEHDSKEASEEAKSILASYPSMYTLINSFNHILTTLRANDKFHGGILSLHKLTWNCRIWNSCKQFKNLPTHHALWYPKETREKYWTSNLLKASEVMQGKFSIIFYQKYLIFKMIDWKQFLPHVIWFISCFTTEEALL